MRSLEREWDVHVGGVLTGGTAAFVAEADRADGTAAVLKIVIGGYFEGHADTDNEFTTLLAADGQGMVRVLAHNRDRAALLLERLGPNLIQLGLSSDERLEAITGAVQQVWRPVGDLPLQSLRDKGPWLAEFIARVWEELGRPCDRSVIENAAAHVARRLDAYDADSEVLLHGDAHGWNTLQDPAGGYKLIDPDGLIGEPAYDLSVPMREHNDELLAGDTVELTRARALRLSELTGVDAQAIWDWGFVERVSTGLLAMQLGMEECRLFLEVAERTARVTQL